MFLTLISTEIKRYESHMDLNALWSWELADYILSFHFLLELLSLFKLMLGIFVCVCLLYSIL